MATKTLLLALLLISCGGNTSTDAVDSAAAPDASPSETSEPQAQPAADAQSADDACGALSVEAIQQHVASAADAEIRVEDQLNAKRYNDDSRSCTWLWDGHRIQLQITTEPAGNKFDSWGSRMLADRLDNRGFAPVEGPGDGAGFSAKGSELFWHEGEGRIYSLSYGGPSPQAKMEVDVLLALASSIGPS